MQNVIHSFHSFFHSGKTSIRLSESLLFCRKQDSRNFPRKSEKIPYIFLSLSIHTMYAFLYKKSVPHYGTLSFLQGFAQDGFGCVGIQAHIRHITGLPFIEGLGTDHGRIVTAEAQGRHIDRSPQLIGS